MRKIVLIVLLLFSLTFVSAIESIVCVPSTVSIGSTIECEIDLAGGNAERNEVYNMTFYNDTAQTIPIPGCSFLGLTQNSPTPIDIIEGCSIPSDFGSSETAVVNFSLTTLQTEVNFQFNISLATSIDLLINEIIFETPVLLGKLTGARWTVSKADTGEPVLGASCTGDVLQSVGGVLVPIAGSTGGFTTVLSKFLGHALTSFIPQATSLDEGTNYIVEIRCDCIPENGGCMNSTGNVLVNSSSAKGLKGIGTSSLFIGTWLTLNTVTDKLNYEVGETVRVCANITNPINRSRQAVEIEYNLRCDSGSNSDTNRILLGEHTELRGISENTIQMQCHDFKIPDTETVEKGANNCQGATDVIVLDSVGDSLVTYSTTSPRLNITTSRIHPEIFWDRISRTKYFANVSFNEFDVGIKSVEVTINQLMHEPDTHATSIKNFSVRFMNGSNVNFDSVISVHERFQRITNGDTIVRDFDVVTISIKNVNTTLDEDLNVTIEFVEFEERSTVALEGIENKTGTFAFSINAKDTNSNTVEFNLSAQLEISNQDEIEGFFSCYIEGYKEITEIQFAHAINKTDPFLTTKTLIVPETLIPVQTVHCDLGFIAFGNDKDTATDTFSILDGGGNPSPSPVQGIVDKIKEKIKDIDKAIDIITKGNLLLKVLLLGVFFILIFCFIFTLIFFNRKRKK